jgi:hypothetical protein
MDEAKKKERDWLADNTLTLYCCPQDINALRKKYEYQGYLIPEILKCRSARRMPSPFFVAKRRKNQPKASWRDGYYEVTLKPGLPKEEFEKLTYWVDDHESLKRFVLRCDKRLSKTRHQRQWFKVCSNAFFMVFLFALLFALDMIYIYCFTPSGFDWETYLYFSLIGVLVVSDSVLAFSRDHCLEAFDEKIKDGICARRYLDEDLATLDQKIEKIRDTPEYLAEKKSQPILRKQPDDLKSR